MVETFAVPTQAVWRDELWDTILDIAALAGEHSWALVGNQAVTAHALAAERGALAAPLTRDHSGHIVTTEAELADLELSMRYLGFTLQKGSTAVSRFHRRDADAGSAEQHPQCWTITAGGSVSSITQAFARRVPYRVTKGARSVSVPVPDLLSAVVFEASRFAHDSDDPFSHARAAAFLVALMDDPAAEGARMSILDRCTLRALDASIGFASHHAWAVPTTGATAFERWTALLRIA